MDEPHEVARTGNLLEEVKWAESAISGDLVPLIGTRQNALDQFNRYNRTAHLLDDSFCNMLGGLRHFGEWQRLPLGQLPAEAAHLTNGSSLFGLRAQFQSQDQTGVNTCAQPQPATTALSETFGAWT